MMPTDLKDSNHVKHLPFRSTGGGAATERKLADYIKDRLPGCRHLLELGSRLQTGELSASFKVTSVEHDRRYVRQPEAWHIFIHVPLADDWYAPEPMSSILRQRYDLVLIDGPVQHRSGLLKHLDLFGHMHVPVLFNGSKNAWDKEVVRGFCKRLGYTFQVAPGGFKRYILCEKLAAGLAGSCDMISRENIKVIGAFISQTILEELPGNGMDEESIFRFSLYMYMGIIKAAMLSSGNARPRRQALLDTILQQLAGSTIRSNERHLHDPAARVCNSEMAAVYSGIHTADKLPAGLSWLENWTGVCNTVLAKEGALEITAVELCRIVNDHLEMAANRLWIIIKLIEKAAGAEVEN